MNAYRLAIGVIAALSTGIIFSGSSASALARAATGDSPTDGLQLTAVQTVTPSPARWLPYVPPALPPASEDGDDQSGGGANVLSSVAPTPLAGWLGPRSPTRSQTMPQIGGSLTGLSNPGTIEPADVQLGVGPTDVVEMVNSSVEIWSKTGKVEAQQSLGQYFTSAASDRRADAMTDPRVLYDQQSGRWFASVLDLTQLQVILVISPTAQPSAGTWIYTFPSSGCQDQPRLGVSDSLVAIGDNLFTACQPGGQLLGGQLTVLDKSDLLSGAVVREQVYGPSLLFASLTPVVSLSSTGTLYFAATDVIFRAIDVFATSQVSASGAVLPVTRVFINAIGDAPDALQSDPALIPTGDDRVQNAVWENGTMWIAVGDGCLVTGETGVHACGRYFGINTTTMSLSMDAGVALDQNRDLYYPAIMPTSDGNLFTVFGYSSAAETPSIGILANPNQTPNWYVLTQGTGANESGRWGDYFGIARDPSDPTHVWIAAAYGNGGNTWATTVAAISASPFSIAPPVAAPPTAKPPAKKILPKKPPICKKGQKSTKQHKCRKRSTA